MQILGKKNTKKMHFYSKKRIFSYFWCKLWTIYHQIVAFVIFASIRTSSRGSYL